MPLYKDGQFAFLFAKNYAKVLAIYNTIEIQYMDKEHNKSMREIYGIDSNSIRQ
jgi:hypothetical protein